MLLSSMSLQVDIQFQLHSINNSLLKALNGLAQLIMGPLDINKDEHKSFLNVVNLTHSILGFPKIWAEGYCSYIIFQVNYSSVVSSYGIIAIDVIKMAIGLGDPVI